jgi:hypothetical protein
MNTGERDLEAGLRFTGSNPANSCFVKCNSMGFMGLRTPILVDKAGNPGGEGWVAKSEFTGSWCDYGSNGLVPDYFLHSPTSINNGIIFADNIMQFRLAGLKIGNGSIHTGDILHHGNHYFGNGVPGSSCFIINGGSNYARNISIMGDQFEGADYSLDFINVDQAVVRACNWGGGTEPRLIGCKNIETDFSELIYAAQITANQNNYNPTDFASGRQWVHAGVLRLVSDAARTITGLKSFGDSRKVTLINAGGFSITLAAESASSSAANRFAGASNIVIAPGQSVQLYWEFHSQRWRRLS